MIFKPLKLLGIALAGVEGEDELPAPRVIDAPVLPGTVAVVSEARQKDEAEKFPGAQLRIGILCVEAWRPEVVRVVRGTDDLAAELFILDEKLDPAISIAVDPNALYGAVVLSGGRQRE